MAHKFLVSTDIAGILGNRSDWEDIWGSVLKDKNFKGFEMIGWKWGKSFFVPSKKYRIAGVHGRTAGWSEGREIVGKLMLSSLNYLFLDINNLIKLNKETDYILLHRGSISRKVESLLIKKSRKIKLLCIENDLVPNSLPRTISKIEFLRQNGVNAGLMFDVVHFLREPHLDEPNIRRWDLLIQALKNLKSLNIPINCHFPIGSYENDSLPLNKITDSMWKELSLAINKVNFRFIVLENQAPRRYSLFLTRSQKLYFRDRSEGIYEKLKHYKII